MAMTPDAHKALTRYCDWAAQTGPPNDTIFATVRLTLEQQQALARALTAHWGRQYACPREIDLKPRHGYESRCMKDGFSKERYIEWLVAGCSDTALIDTDHVGRPRLVIRHVQDESSCTYDFVVPINSDTHGRVHIGGVIPSGRPARQKKTAPSAIP